MFYQVMTVIGHDSEGDLPILEAAAQEAGTPLFLDVHSNPVGIGFVVHYSSQDEADRFTSLLAERRPQSRPITSKRG